MVVEQGEGVKLEAAQEAVYWVTRSLHYAAHVERCDRGGYRIVVQEDRRDRSREWVIYSEAAWATARWKLRQRRARYGKARTAV